MTERVQQDLEDRGAELGARAAPLTPVRAWGRVSGYMQQYLKKMRGTTRGSPPRVSNAEVAWSWVGGFLGIAAIAWLSESFAGVNPIMMVGSFGASAVLVFGAVRSPLAQPRNVIGGHIVSALVGVAAFKLLGDHLWLAEATAVASAIALMHLTKTLHPPGGATALIAVIGGEKVHSLGFNYALAPVGAGATIMVLIAVLVNNVPASRRYPEIWF
jgi:CBS-domain-containing membrane protein